MAIEAQRSMGYGVRPAPVRSCLSEDAADYVASFVFKAALRDVSGRQLEEKINEMLQQHQDWVDPEVVMRRIAVEWRRCPHQKLPARVSYMFIKTRSEEHTSELQSLMRISYAVFCLKKK